MRATIKANSTALNGFEALVRTHVVAQLGTIVEVLVLLDVGIVEELGLDLTAAHLRHDCLGHRTLYAVQDELFLRGPLELRRK